MTESITVAERGTVITFTYADMMRYHGPHSPAGVAMAFKVLQRTLALLSPVTPPDRRSIMIRTAFRGPGARDGFEAVTRAVSDGRYSVDRTLVGTELGPLREDFVFEVALRGSRVTVALRDGFVTEEFVDLARSERRSADQEHRLDELKAALAATVMASAPDVLFDIEDSVGARE